MAHLDPWLIYVLSIVDGIKCLSWILLSISIVAIVILAIITCSSYNVIDEARIDDITKEYYTKSFKLSRKYLIVSIALLIINIFMIILVPSKSTIQQMIDASLGTNIFAEESKEVSKPNSSEIHITISE